MICLAILAIGAGLQFPTTPVTYETRAARASVVLKELSAAAKCDLQTTAATESEVLVIDVKGRPIGEVMARIAAATSGKWRQDGKTYRLVADEIIRRKEEKSYLAARSASIRDYLKQSSEYQSKQEAKIAAQRDKLKEKTQGSNEERAKALAESAGLDMQVGSPGTELEFAL